MLTARVEPKNGPKENRKIGNFKPLVLSEFQAAVDKSYTGSQFRSPLLHMFRVKMALLRSTTSERWQ